MNTLPPIDAGTIQQAASLLLGRVNRTPVYSSQTLNRVLDSEVFFKCENLQKAGAFKSRGATHAILRLSNSQLAKGVATHSSGNHAQALARAAALAGTAAYIVMPSNS
ncbi:MAG TPA: pyridoxal-phosphate dependent enzyme, partial [Bacteroidales bacterium]|nr:pyridoxal-phosphate dependent enzyme [Bacteroidales bacterium]